VIEAKAIIAAGVHVGRNCIISAGAVLEKSSTVEPNVLIGSACTIMKGSVIPEFSRMPAGRVFEQNSRALRADV
jgi:UDP-3-O-[3-hydroxymyristoyl] glucosamine N-acyltransferase